MSPPDPEPSDGELMKAYIGGDKTAFRSLFARYSPLVRRILARELDRQDEVDDLIQQTFLQMHRARRDFRQDAALRPWLVTIALNVKRQYLRHRKRKPATPTDIEASLAGAGTEPTQPRAVGAAQVRRALQSLPEGQRDCIVLHWFEGLSFSEIAEISGIKTSAAKVRAHRGYDKLRQILGDEVTELLPQA